ncbi:TetR/AcrR family transcriptional regulator [soil metagenome]
MLNNERLVQAAREVFARQGFSATLEDIAKHAGVGVGTIYRNFASKREIVETLYDAAMDSALEDVRAALEIEDPWLAIVTFFEVSAAHQARDRGLYESFAGHAGPNEKTTQKLLAALTPVFERAARAGVLRQGVTATDVGPVFAMLSAVYGMSSASPDLWRRYLALMLDGLRATERPPLPVPALDPPDFTRALAAS